MRANLNLIQGDCMEGMAGMRDNEYSLAIVDPPYFSGPEKRAFYGHNEQITERTEYKPLKESWTVPNFNYFKELVRVSKHQIIWGCNYYEFGCRLPGRIVWDKCNPSSNFSDCELAATSVHDSVRLFRYMWNGMMQGRGVESGHVQQGNKKLNEKRIHPTQKPVALYKWLLANYAKEGDRILDTHGGSMSSMIACWDGGFDATCYEMDPDYYAAAVTRVEKHKAQGQFNFNNQETVT